MKKILLVLQFVVALSTYAQVALTSGGSGNAYTLAYPGVFSYTKGISVTFIASFANTGPATININNGGVKSMTKQTSVSLTAGDIIAGQMVILVYDGTNFQVVSMIGSPSNGSLPSGTFGQTLYNNGSGGYTASSMLYNNGGSVGVNNSSPDASAALDVQSGSRGVLLPRMSTGQRDAILNPAAGLMIYNTDDSCFNYYSGATWVDDCGSLPNVNAGPAYGTSAGGTGTSIGYGTTTDASGYTYTTGNYTGTITLGGTSLSGGNIFITKNDPSGNVVWAQSANAGASYAIAVDASANVYITGSTSSSGATFGGISLTNISGTSSNMFIAKFNAAGVAQWAKNAGATAASSTAAGYALTIYSNTVIVTGNTSSGGLMTFPGTSTTLTYSGFFIVSYSTSIGSINWAQGPWGFTSPNSIYNYGITNDGQGVYISGYTSGALPFDFSSTLSRCIFIAKYGLGISSQGVLQWVVNADSAGISGLSTPFTTSGLHGNAPIAYANGFLYTACISDGSTIAGGTVQVSAPPGYTGNSMLITQFDTAGNFVNFVSDCYSTTNPGFGGAPQAITCDASGSVFVTGILGTVGTGTGAGYLYSLCGQTLTGLGGTDVFVAKYSATLSPLMGLLGGGSGVDYGSGVSVDASSNMFVTGFFNGSANFSGKTFAGGGGNTYFLVKYRATGNSTQANGTLSANQTPIPGIVYSGNTLSVSDGNSVTLPWGTNGSTIYSSPGNVGVNTQSANSQFEVNGSFATAIAKKTANTTLDNTAAVWYFQPTAAITVTLPAASTCTNRRYVITNVTSFAATVTPTFYNFTHTLTGTGPTNGSIEIISDGTNWLQIK